MKKILFILFTWFISFNQANAVTITINPTTTGGFASPNTGWTDMTLGWTFNGSGEQINITSSGSITLTNSPNFTTDPDGITRTIDGSIIGINTFFPLEEASLDIGSLVLPRPLGSSITQIGALMAAFIPEAVLNSPNFFSRDEDLVSLGENGIASSDLFFVGTGLLNFVAPEAGSLFFGINDTFAANNIGQYDVTINAVPIPSSVFLFGSGIFGLYRYQVRSKETKSVANKA